MGIARSRSATYNFRFSASTRISQTTYSTMKKPRQIALLFPMSRPHLTRMLRGITDYAQQHGPWSLHVNPEQPTASVRVLEGWQGDGALAVVNQTADLKAAQHLNLPVVNLSAAHKNPVIRRVTVDHHAVGRLAAEHLLARGFRRFAYYGLKNVWYAQERGRGFIETVEQQGAHCVKMEDRSSLTKGRAWRDSHEALRRWLTTLQPPVGLLAVHDIRASMAIDSCQQAGLRVPDDVAVVGVNDDTVICDFCSVPISSVSRNDWKVGYEAAAMLDRLMHRRKVASDEILIPPDRVVLRQSSDVLAINDPEVEKVVRYIREHLHEDFSIDELVQLVPLSRRWLQQRFKEYLGVTLYKFIVRERIDRAKKLLVGEKRLQLGEIARQCGFSETRLLRKNFERLEGITPTQFRRNRPEGTGFEPTTGNLARPLWGDSHESKDQPP